ncbi:MAG: F0F1 ATP synthase subunit epsilon [Bacteroidales bacterium]|nr:F0F1 ATP synthase subunit epsilon [Bacteroidales bacterium]
MADKTLTIRILTPEGTLHEGAATAVFLPGTVSPFEVLPDHAPIISALSAGDIRVVDGEERRFAIRGGVVKVKDNEIVACVEER